jgi:predicted outer membrane protein
VIDIDAAHQAIAKAKNKAVVGFANDMLRDHQEVMCFGVQK